MSITLDDKAVDVFKLFDEMAIAYSNDIESYQALIEAIGVMIAQKQRKLQDVKDKNFDLITSSITALETTPSLETPLLQPDKKFNYAGIDMEALIPGPAIESGEAVVETAHAIAETKQSQAATPPKVQRPGPAREKKTTGKSKVRRAGKPKKPTLRPKNIAEKSKDDQFNASLEKMSLAKTATDITELKCKYHPESPVLDMARQLCSSCKWKLITNGLKKYDKEPSVISFLKGETTKIPDLGQPMCPVHPAIPSYNQKTGLCKACQKKAKAIGVQDRHLTEEELTVLRNPFS
ncbi:MAG: hypothetical protein V1844_27185 [Pseudomonadota bacterium]